MVVPRRVQPRKVLLMKLLPATSIILVFRTQRLDTILNQQTLMVTLTLQRLLEQLKLLMVFSLAGQVQRLKMCLDGK